MLAGGTELRGFAPIGVLACPGASCLEYNAVLTILRGPKS